MATQYVIMPLFEDAFYSYSISLQDETYIVSVQYNERSEQWILNLADADSVPIFEGVGLVPLYPIALDYAIFPLTGFFWLEPIADINVQQYKLYPEQLNQFYRMYYIYNDGEE